MSEKDFSDWSNARRQIYAAKCLEAFARHFGVEDVSVEMLLAHLKKIDELDFGKWERAGAILPLNGRGDAKPSGLEEKIPSNIRSDFFKLVDFVVEIGIVDSYGERSMLPLKFLNDSIEILQAHSVSVPKQDF